MLCPTWRRILERGGIEEEVVREVEDLELEEEHTPPLLSRALCLFRNSNSEKRVSTYGGQGANGVQPREKPTRASILLPILSYIRPNTRPALFKQTSVTRWRQLSLFVSSSIMPSKRRPRTVNRPCATFLEVKASIRAIPCAPWLLRFFFFRVSGSESSSLSSSSFRLRFLDCLRWSDEITFLDVEGPIISLFARLRARRWVSPAMASIPRRE
jgi:hypothetical protein